MARKVRQQVSHESYKTGQVIILGFTGSLGSGCTFLAEGIKKSIGSDAHYFRLSKYIRVSLKQKGIRNPTVAQLQNEGNRLRRENGLNYLVERCVDEMLAKERKQAFNANSVILVDGIRNTSEVHSLRAIPNFFLISVHALKQTRQDRLVGPNKLFTTAGDFATADERDLDESGINYGQKVQLCNDLADIIVNNDDNFAEGGINSKNQFVSNFVNSFLPIMHGLREGQRVVDRPPTMDEVMMTMAFCASQRSSCEKRKVGAVIAFAKRFPHVSSRIKRPEDDLRCQIVSSGYNEVPLGTEPCNLARGQQCYRDRLKEMAVSSFLRCPKCGIKISQQKVRSFESLRRHICGCGFQLKMCLPGAGDATGRLLDMCKALHAEENAILGLHGVAKTGEGELVLYTTTFPCNLCANKIVEAGIKTVVFAEPYPMKEAEEILKFGGVSTRKFEGVKSTAFFRIFS